MPDPSRPSTPVSTAARGAGRVISVVAGSVTVLVALALLAAGGVLLWADGHKDPAGYISTGTDRFHTSSYALATETLDVDADVASGIVKPDRYGTIRIKATSRDRKPVFVGIAPTRDVAAYLRGTAHTTISDISYSPFRPDYRPHAGTAVPARPATRRFWTASAHGSGTQQVTWDVRDGSWSVVVMNDDASRGVDVGVSAGADVPALEPAAWGALGTGFVLLLVAGGLLYAGLRSRTPRPEDPGSGIAPLPAT